MTEQEKIQEKVCYLAINNEKNGPLSEDDIRQLFAEGKVNGETMFARVGDTEWVPLSATGILPSGSAESLAGADLSFAAASVQMEQPPQESGQGRKRNKPLIFALAGVSVALVVAVTILLVVLIGRGDDVVVPTGSDRFRYDDSLLDSRDRDRDRDRDRNRDRDDDNGGAVGVSPAPSIDVNHTLSRYELRNFISDDERYWISMDFLWTLYEDVFVWSIESDRYYVHIFAEVLVGNHYQVEYFWIAINEFIEPRLAVHIALDAGGAPAFDLPWDSVNFNDAGGLDWVYHKFDMLWHWDDWDDWDDWGEWDDWGMYQRQEMSEDSFWNLRAEMDWLINFSESRGYSTLHPDMVWDYVDWILSSFHWGNDYEVGFALFVTAHELVPHGDMQAEFIVFAAGRIYEFSDVRFQIYALRAVLDFDPDMPWIQDEIDHLNWWYGTDW